MNRRSIQTRSPQPSPRALRAQIFATCGALAFACIAIAAPSAQAAPCENEELRQGPSANLPDCRAYEMVSPLAKNGYYVNSGNPFADGWGQASAVGGAVAYTSLGAFPGSTTNALSNFYLASRGEAGWSTQSLLPPQAFSYSATPEPVFAAYSPDLSKGILLDATDSPLLTAGEQETTTAGTANLFLRDNVTGAYSLINAAAPGTHPLPYQPILDGASADFGTVIFDANGALTPEAPGGGVDNLYESAGGALSLVSQIPPAGEPSCGPVGSACLPAPHGGKFGSANAAHALSEHGSLVRAISSDGSRIFFTAESNLYVRENGETTIQVDAPQAQPPGPGGGGVWATAAADGSKVFFYDDASAGLTNDTVPGSGTNLYGYDTLTGALTDLTPSPEAGVQGVVDEASEDGSYLYFVATGVLTTEKNSLEEEAQAGTENLYLSHDGAISFIHTVADVEVASRGLMLAFHSGARVTPDGRHLAFFAEESGEHGEGVQHHKELFEYSADSGQLSHLCACAGSRFPQPEQGTTTSGQALSVFQYTRALSDDGAHVFLETYEALLPRDTNGQLDVYEYEQGGAGSCHVASGCLYLISSGTSKLRSDFVDAGASGNNVFFTTAQQLVPSDTDGAFDLYDAREKGGFPQPPSPAPCLGDACQVVPPATSEPTLATSVPSGPGNEHPTKPVAKHHKPKRKRSHMRHRTRRANTNRRAGK
jgi:hypothetical protein